MARLDPKPYPVPRFMPGQDYDEHSKKEDAALAPIEDKLLRFPVADGYAVYFVKSMKPLVLQHVPIGDAYQIPAAHLRGLNAQDVRTMLMRQQRVAAMFSKQS